MRSAFQDAKDRMWWLLMSTKAFPTDVLETLGRDDDTVALGDKLWKYDKLAWNISQLCSFGRQHSMPTSYYFASIDELLARSLPNKTAQIDQVLYDFLSDFVAITEALSAINYHVHHKPWIPHAKETARYAPITNEIDTGMLEKRVTESSIGDTSIQDRLVPKGPTADTPIWEKLREFRKLPKPTSSMSEQNLNRRICLHEAMDAFWKEVHDVKTAELQKAVPEKLSQEHYDQ